MTEWALLRFCWLAPAWRGLKRAKAGDRARGLLFAGGFAAFLGVLFGILKPIAVFFWTQAEIGPLLIQKAVYLIFSILFAMLVLSSLIAGTSRLFNSRDEEPLLSSPLAWASYFRFRFWQACLASSWMFLPLWIPLLFALKHAGDFKWGFVAWGLLAPLPMAPLATALAFIFLMETAGRLSLRKMRGFLLTFGALAVAGLLFLLRTIQPEKMANPDSAKSAAEFLRTWSAAEPWLNPARHAAAAVIRGIQDPWSAMLGFAWLLGASLLALGFCFWRYQGRFRQAWFKVKDASELGGEKSGASRWLGFVSSPASALLFKEGAALSRRAIQRVQFILLASVIALFAYNLEKLPFKDDPGNRNMLFLPACGFALLLLIAVATRFIFPAESLESKGQWMLRTIPLSGKAYLRSRLAIYFPILLLAGLVLYISVERAFDPPFLQRLAALALFAFSPLGIASLTAFLGLAWKKADASEPEEVTTSAAGVGVMSLCFFYVMAEILIVSVLLWEKRRHGLELWKGGYNWALIVSGLVLWLALQAWAVFWPAQKALKAMREGA